VVAKQVAGPHQQVLIGDQAAPPALLRVGEDQVAQLGRDPAQRRGPGRSQDARHLLGDRMHGVPDDLARVDPVHGAPVSQGARIAELRHLLQRQQGGERRILVRRLAQSGRHQAQRVHPLVQLVGRAAEGQQVDAPLHVLGEHPRRGDRRDRPHRPGRLLDDVPVVTEGEEQVQQLVGAQPEQEASAHRLGARLPRGQRVEPAAESLPDVEITGEVGQGLEVRRQPGLQRMHPEERRAEGVNGLDAGAVHLRCGVREPGPFLLPRGTGGGRLQLLADAHPQLASRRDGERDRHQPLHGQSPGGDPGDDRRDHRGGLPGAGAGLDEERPLQLGDQSIAFGLIGDGWAAHGSSPGWSACSARYGARAESPLLASARESRPVGQSPL